MVIRAHRHAAARPTNLPLLTKSGRGLQHVTLGISLRDIAGYLPLTARGVTAGGRDPANQQRQVFNSNQTLVHSPRGNHGSQTLKSNCGLQHLVPKCTSNTVCNHTRVPPHLPVLECTARLCSHCVFIQTIPFLLSATLRVWERTSMIGTTSSSPMHRTRKMFVERLSQRCEASPNIRGIWTGGQELCL